MHRAASPPGAFLTGTAATFLVEGTLRAIAAAAISAASGLAGVAAAAYYLFPFYSASWNNLYTGCDRLWSTPFSQLALRNLGDPLVSLCALALELLGILSGGGIGAWFGDELMKGRRV